MLRSRSLSLWYLPWDAAIMCPWGWRKNMKLRSFGEPSARRLRSSALMVCVLRDRITSSHVLLAASKYCRKLTSTWPLYSLKELQRGRQWGRDALEGKGPQRRPRRRFDRQLEELPKRLGAVTVGYKCC